ncbi:MAG: GNAT family N-acetyltransferase [Anaerolineales bacterium]|jgi:RimJ/RimL family protein N-acetyltransferase|uniref:GNAT family N-acetyltransferase n=1 Tax=Candidatus Villigracilis vicinus TaxID=3140679 RepID=UPI0031365381|nr:GNAT family N-acetyltransferase [Anaerolineales bacterium]
MFPFAKMTDGVIVIRPYEFGEEKELYTAVKESLPELTPWMSWATEKYTLNVARDFIIITRSEWSRGALYSFAITDAITGEFLGGCGLSHFHPIYKFCNLGYWVRTPKRGRGIAVRAAKLAARFAFERAGTIRAEIVIAEGNEASKRVAEKAGAHYEGILRNRITVREQILDAYMFSLLPTTFGLVAHL